MKLTEQANSALDKILTAFKNGDVPKAIAKVMNPKGNTPSHLWSFNNQLIMLFSGTEDARGFKQWKDVKRSVKKGSKAIHILAPITFTVKDTDENGNEVKKTIPKGFRAIPVFKYEDTEGEALPEEKDCTPETLPPLFEVAQLWKIDVQYISGGRGYYGFFSEGQNKIGMATQNEQTFLHELAHAAHYRLRPDMKQTQGQDPFKEIVAELTACSLASMFNCDNMGYTFEYVTHYAAQQNIDATKACLNVLDEVKQVIELITSAASQTQSQAA